MKTARDIAATGNLQESDIAAAPFRLRSYQRIREPLNGEVRIYIEGDGLAWLDRQTPSPDSTPVTPMALLLAQADDSPNVFYLARPCQYNTALLDGQACPAAYWMDAQFAPEVIGAVNSAISDIVMSHGFRHVELVGFSGGAAIAVLVAAKRNDVKDIRTVAGNLDTRLFSKIHDISPLNLSLNPVSAAKTLATVPQIHFIGADDQIAPADLYNNYRAAMPNNACIQEVIVPEMTHYSSWNAEWKNLLGRKFSCQFLGETPSRR